MHTRIIWKRVDQLPPPPIVVAIPPPFEVYVNGVQWNQLRNMTEVWSWYRDMVADGQIGDRDHIVVKDIRDDHIEASF